MLSWIACLRAFFDANKGKTAKASKEILFYTGVLGSFRRVGDDGDVLSTSASETTSRSNHTNMPRWLLYLYLLCAAVPYISDGVNSG